MCWGIISLLLASAFGVALSGDLAAEYVKRSGSAPRTHTCGNVRPVPGDIAGLMKLDTSWYAKYTEAYGIPILGSAEVSDQALVRACYVMRFLFAGSQKYRDNIYQAGVHVTIMAKSEQLTDVPEQRDWDKSMNSRYRGMSAVLGGKHPTTGAEENLLCECGGSNDKFWLEDYFLHEAAHTLHLIGVNPSVPTFEQQVKDAREAAKASGKWGHVYGTRDGVSNPHHEYFAEAVQSYFGNNLWSAAANGWHGPINSPSAVEAADPTVYNLIKSIIPCGNANNFIDRCTDAMSGFKKGVTQKLLMDESCTPETASNDAPSFPADNTCEDRATPGYCGILTGFKYCDASKFRVPAGTIDKCCGCTCGCTKCSATGKCSFVDSNGRCPQYKEWGECTRNPGWMNQHCRKSCLDFESCKPAK